MSMRAACPSPRLLQCNQRSYREALQAYYAAVREQNRADEATFTRLGEYHAWALRNRQQVIER